MERGARTKLVAALVLSAVFGSGLLLGYAADRKAGPDTSEAETVATAPESTVDGERPRRPMVYEQLNPSPEQREVIDSIFVVHRARMNALDKEYRDVRHDYQARYDAVIQDTREAIADVFPPDMATEYRRLLAEYDERRAAERAGRN